MNHAGVKNYFDLLKTVMFEHNLFKKPSNIWNYDEIGVQLNNELNKIVAAKVSEDVYVVTSVEKRETIIIMTYFNAEGKFLPPFYIFKGVYFKSQHTGTPSGTMIKMRKESAYISSELFMNWRTDDHFIPRKPPGKNLLILNGHFSHKENVPMLQIATDNDIVIVWLPSHIIYVE